MRKRHHLIRATWFAILYTSLLAAQYVLYQCIGIEPDTLFGRCLWFVNFAVAVSFVATFLEALRGFRYESDLIWVALGPAVYATVLYMAFDIWYAFAVPFVLAFDVVLFAAFLWVWGGFRKSRKD